MTQKKKPKIAVCIDHGSAYLSISVHEARKQMSIDWPMDGPQLPTVAYCNSSGEWSFGEEAYIASYDGSGVLMMHAKRNLQSRAREAIYDGKYTPIDVVAKTLECARQQLLAARPDFSDYPQFGGAGKPEEDLVLTFSIPAEWAIEQQSIFREAIHAAGFCGFAGFVAEPIAAAQSVCDLASVDLKQGAKLEVIDLGAGTCDVAVLEYRDGAFHQIHAASGSNHLGGHDFTNALAAQAAHEFRFSWKGLFSEGGLNLAAVAAKYKPAAVSIFQSADLAKRRLAASPRATVPIDLPKGKKNWTITRDKARELWEELFKRYQECVKEPFNGRFAPSDMDHIILAGGSSPIPGLREKTAEALGRGVTDVYVSTDSASLVSAGGAQIGLYQSAVSSCLETGLGFTLGEPGNEQHHLFIPPGEILPPHGLFQESAGFVLNASQSETLVVKPWVCKRGVTPALCESHNGILADEQVLPLEEIDKPVKEFGRGVHEVVLGVRIDPNRIMYLLIRPTNIPGAEPIAVKVSLAERKAAKSATFDIMLCLDCSGSMCGAKIEALKKGAVEFCKLAVANGCKVGIVAFGIGAFTEVKLVSDITSDLSGLERAIRELSDCGSTPMGRGLALCRKHLTGPAVVVLFSDGQPTDDPRPAAQALKRAGHRISTVGIGEDAIEPLLRDLASSPKDYEFAKGPADIFTAFEAKARLLFQGDRGGGPQSNGPNGEQRPKDSHSAPKPEKQASPPKTNTDYDEDWGDLDQA